MTDLLIRDLAPSTLYNIQLRQRTSTQLSDWSPLLSFTTDEDTTAPAAPTSLTWVSVGRSFLGTWVAPTLDTNGLPLYNFEKFQARITHVPSGASVIYETTALRLDFTYEMNEAKFGTPKSPLRLEVRAVNSLGVAGDWSASVTATNPVPNALTVTATAAIEQIGLKWGNPTDTDLKGFVVYGSQTIGFTPGPGNQLTFTNAQSFTHYTSSTSPWYFHVRAVDIFDQEGTSTQVTATAVASAGNDTTAPDPPTSVTATAGFDNTLQRAYLDMAWVASASSDVRNYTIRYAAGAASDWQYAVIDGALTSARIFVEPGTNYYTAVNARDFSGNSSGYVNASVYPRTSSTDTSAPSTPAAATAVGNTLQVQVTHDNTKAAGGAIEADVAYYDVYASTTTGFTTYNSTTHIGKLIRSTVTSMTFPLPVTTAAATWYVKVIAVDRSGNASAASAQVSVVPGLIQTANIADANITSAKIVTLVADKITAGAGIIANLTIGNATTAGTVASYDYVAGTTGWKIGGTSGGVNILEINTGLVKAGALELKSSFNLMPPTLADFEARPATYLPEIFASGCSTTIVPDPYTGTGSLQALQIAVDDPAGWNISLGVDPNTPVETGKKYIVSFYAKASAAVTVTGSLLYNTLADLEEQESVEFVNASLTTSYARYYYNVTIPGTATKAKQKFSGINPAGTLITIDALQIEEQVGALTTPSRWQPPSSTLIDGGQIQTGSIQSSDTSSGRPAWAINMAGKAIFADAQIIGSLVVGETVDTAFSYIQSGNYATDTAGWKISSNGLAELNDAVIRGTAQLQYAQVAEDLSIVAESGADVATLSISNGSIATVYGKLAPPPQLQVGSAGFVTTTIAEQIGVSASTRIAGPTYNAGGTGFFARAYLLTDGLSFAIRLSSFTHSTGAFIALGAEKTFTMATYGVVSTEYLLEGLSWDGTNFWVGMRTPTGLYLVKFDSSMAWVSNTTVPVDTLRDQGYRANHQVVGTNLYSAYCANSDVETNIIYNPTFVSGITNWTNNGAAATTIAHDSGNQRINVSSSAADSLKKQTSSFLTTPAVTAGDYVYLTATVRKGAHPGTFYAKMTIPMPDGSSISTTGIVPVTGGTTLTLSGVAPASGSLDVVLEFYRLSGTWNSGVVIGSWDDVRMSNNGPRPRKTAYSFASGSTSGWVWSGTTNNSESHRSIPAGRLIVQKRALASLGTVATENYGHDLHSDITGFSVGNGDYGRSGALFGAATVPATFAIMRKLYPYANLPENNYGIQFFAYVNPNSSGNLALREGAYLSQDGLAYNSNTGHYYAYSRSGTKIEELPYVHNNLTGGLSVVAVYKNTTLGYDTLASKVTLQPSYWARHRILITGLSVPNVPGTVAVGDRPDSWQFFVGTGGTTDLTKMQLLNTTSFAGYTSGGVYLTDTTSVPTGTATNLVPNNPSATAATYVDTVDGFAAIAGFTASKLRSANDVFSVDGNGSGKISGLSFSENGLVLLSLGGTSGQITSNTGGLILRHDGYADLPGLFIPAYKKAQTVAQTLTSGTTTTITQGGTASPDDGSWSYSAGTFTCILPGTYIIVASVAFVGNATGNRHLSLEKNGVQLTGQGGSSINAIQFVQSCTALESCGVGDTVSATARQQSGGNLNTVVGSITSMTFIRLGAV